MASSVVEAAVNADESEITHPSPVWKERADFIIGVQLDDGGSEQLWARQLDAFRFEICCIPFFAYDLALGDVVETTERFELTRVLEPSGRYVFRVWLGDSNLSGDAVANELVEIGGVVEWSSANLLAIDASSEDLAQRIAKYLHEREHEGQLTYETGRS